MGWFLSSGSKRKSKAKKQWKRSQKRREPWDAAKSRRWALRSLWLLAGIGLIVGSVFGYRHIHDSVARMNAALPSVVMVDAPEWMGPTRTEPMRRTVAATVSPNPMDRNSLELAAAELTRSPWIESVDQIRRGYDGRIEVQATYREPAALVEARDGYHLVDEHARRLPGVYPLSQVGELDLPVLRGVEAAPPVQGHAWAGEDVQAGLRLARYIRGAEFADQVRWIDVSNHDGRVNRGAAYLVLLTDEGGVGWGRAPGEEDVHEPPAGYKLAMLRRVAERYRGRIDADGQYVSLLHQTPMIHPRSSVRYTSGR